MKKLLFLCVLLLTLVSVKAQRVYFMYLQSENGTPFFVKMNDKVFSSTTSGYLILPKLKDSTYTFTVGKVGGTKSELRFSVTIANNDKGFLIRETDRGLSLVNLQTNAVENPATTDVGFNSNVERRTDAFTRLLAKAADDSSLLMVAYVPKEEKKKVTKEPERKVVLTETEQPKPTATTDDVAVVKEDAIKKETQQTTTAIQKDTVSAPQTSIAQTKTEEKIPVKQDEIVAKETPVNKVAEVKEEVAQPKKETIAVNENNLPAIKEYKRSVVTRKSESSTSEGFGLVFLDKSTTTTDTIRILIPNPKNAVKLAIAETEKEKPEVTTPVSSAPAPSATATQKKEKLACIYLATDAEFKRLRRIMAAKSSDEGMLNEARRGFKSTCFTTEQIRNLSSLFLTAEGKYTFFDVAYGHAVDSEAFVTLGSEIKDDYYNKRFKALVGN
ncbi:MAG TPA: DUF4476 domain-containing protein [Chitinophagaceae bacterium]|nr:DUF4476 domain-containing protein [Chitinophagaceae bacterium]